ncbi:MAG: hypothetical protein JOZ24_01090, partial [Candidatus Eremiobacteraeota bacterium]|nr:hypothetical protein [Candidatus Eremiobacteraeota bacterium]
DLSNPAQDVSIKNHILTASTQFLFTVAAGGRKLPIVVAPTYFARWGTISGHSDVQQIEYNGYPTITRLRTEQSYLVPITIPFVSTPRVFAAVTAAPQWLVHTAGVNQDNHAQIFELLYAEYRATKRDTIWIQPSRVLDYLPNDPYTEYVPTFIAGISHRFNPWAFVQVSLQSGAATNRSPYGVTAVTCQRLPCAASQVAPSVGGLHAAQVQIQYGLGSPTVIPL